MKDDVDHDRSSGDHEAIQSPSLLVGYLAPIMIYTIEIAFIDALINRRANRESRAMTILSRTPH